MTANMRRQSRYPSPGTLASAFWEDADNGYRLVQAHVAVMGTSRHKRSIDEAQALDLLRDHYGDDLEGIKRIGYWRSVTQFDVECDTVGDSDAGDWNEEGSGSAWVRVAYPTLRDSGSPSAEADR